MVAWEQINYSTEYGTPVLGTQYLVPSTEYYYSATA